MCSKLADLLMANTSLQPKLELPFAHATRTLQMPIRLCGTTPTDVVPTKYYVEELWAALDKMLQHSGCGVGSDTPLAQGGPLNPTTFKIVGAPAPIPETPPQPRDHNRASLAPPRPPPEYLPEMKDAEIIKTEKFMFMLSVLL